MRAIITNKILLQDIPSSFGQELTERLTLLNPKWTDNQKMNRWNGRTIKFLKFYNWTDQGLSIPRGFISQLKEMATQQGLSLTWNDRTRVLPEVEFKFNGQLRDYQAQAIEKIRPQRFATLEAPTGSGKTIIALAMIAMRWQPTLIIIHVKTLLEQWRERINQFLGIPADRIGVIGGGRCEIRPITVSTVQSLYKIADQVKEHFGHVICDEVQHCPSRQMSEAVSTFDSRFMLGLSATAYRRDGLTPLISWFIGETAHRIEQGELTQAGAILPFKVKWIKTDYRTNLDPSAQYSATLSELTQDPERNRLVGQEAARYTKNGGGMPLVLSDRKAHCQAIAETLSRDFGVNADLLTGDLSKKAREKVVSKLNAGQCKALVATGQLIGEGFDLPALGAVLLATPIRFKGRLLQSIGRALRPSPGQNCATVIDFVDSHVGALKASARARAKVYSSRGAL